MPRDATAEQIRAAYRRQARLVHPDRGMSGERMTELNAAYRVLGNHDRRARFDAGQQRPAAATNTTANTAAANPATPTEPAPHPPPEPSQFPWKSMLVAAVVGTIAVGAISLAAGPGEDEPPDGIVTVGSCVEVIAVNEVREVDCESPGALVVESMVPLDGRCPTNRVEYRDRLGLGKVCVDP